MADHPMLFKTPMVQALLREIAQPGGGKTQTRRMVTPHNSLFNGETWRKNTKAQTWDWAKAWVDAGPSPAGNPGPYLKLPWLAGDEDPWEGSVHRIYPRVQPGDRIWVRERCQTCEPLDDRGNVRHVTYYADPSYGALPQTFGKWDCRPRNSIHMPRWASRLTLLVEDVRIERVQEISEQDARAEGIQRDSSAFMDAGWWDYESEPMANGEPSCVVMSPVASYASLWRAINGPESWDANPWVWVYVSRPILANIDSAEARAA